MRRLVIAMLFAAVAVSAAATGGVAATTAYRAHAKVSPATGKPSTKFAVRFRNPVRTGTFPATRIWETVSATGPKSTSSCSGTAGMSVRPAAAQARLRVRLAPTGMPWCPGPYIGTVSLYQETRCRPGPVGEHRVCPLLVFAPERIGRFRFTVRRVQP